MTTPEDGGPGWDPSGGRWTLCRWRGTLSHPGNLEVRPEEEAGLGQRSSGDSVREEVGLGQCGFGVTGYTVLSVQANVD